MRVFITGATGYIGGSVASALIAAGHEVSGLVRNPIQVVVLAGAAWSLAPSLAPLALLLAPAVGMITWLTGARVRRRAREVRLARDAQHTGSGTGGSISASKTLGARCSRIEVNVCGTSHTNGAIGCCTTARETLKFANRAQNAVCVRPASLDDEVFACNTVDTQWVTAVVRVLSWRTRNAVGLRGSSSRCHG